jgi:hypothetical protein
MIGQSGDGQGGDLDFAEVARDNDLLNLLAARAEVTAGDEVTAMLASLAAEIDQGLELLLREQHAGSRPAGEPAARTLVAVPSPRRRTGFGLRASTVAVVLGATLSVSGVAAAVTGDPFAPYKGIVSAVAGDNGASPQAAREAALRHRLAGTRALIAHGDLGSAQDQLAATRAWLATATGLTYGQRRSLEARIAELEASLARAGVRRDALVARGHSGSTTHGSSGVAGSSGTKTSEPNHSGTTGSDHSKANPQPANTAGPKQPKPEKKSTGSGATTEPARPKPSTSRGSGRPQSSSTDPAETKSTDPVETGQGGSGPSAATQP